jgi:hypothetical protein
MPAVTHAHNMPTALRSVLHRCGLSHCIGQAIRFSLTTATPTGAV